MNLIDSIYNPDIEIKIMWILYPKDIAGNKNQIKRLKQQHKRHGTRTEPLKLTRKFRRVSSNNNQRNGNEEQTTRADYIKSQPAKAVNYRGVC
jgi:hypothetical protein